MTDRCCPCGLGDLEGLLKEGTDAFEQQDRSKDEYADGGDAVDDEKNLEVEFVAEMGCCPGNAVPIEC